MKGRWTRPRAASRRLPGRRRVADARRHRAGCRPSQPDGGERRRWGNPECYESREQKAEELGVDLSQVKGSGPEGRITVKDVMNAANRG